MGAIWSKSKDAAGENGRSPLPNYDAMLSLARRRCRQANLFKIALVERSSLCFSPFETYSNWLAPLIFYSAIFLWFDKFLISLMASSFLSVSDPLHFPLSARQANTSLLVSNREKDATRQHITHELCFSYLHIYIFLKFNAPKEPQEVTVTGHWRTEVNFDYLQWDCSPGLTLVIEYHSLQISISFWVATTPLNFFYSWRCALASSLLKFTAITRGPFSLSKWAIFEDFGGTCFALKSIAAISISADNQPFCDVSILSPNAYALPPCFDTSVHNYRFTLNIISILCILATTYYTSLVWNQKILPRPSSSCSSETRNIPTLDRIIKKGIIHVKVHARITTKAVIWQASILKPFFPPRKIP